MFDLDAVLKDLAKLFVSNIHTLIITERGKLKLTEGTNAYVSPPYTKLYVKLYNVMPFEIRTKVLTIAGGAHAYLEQGMHGQQLYAAIEVEIKAAGRNYKKLSAPSPNDSFFNDTITTPLSKLKLILNLQDKKNSFLYNPVEDIIYAYDYEIIQTRLKEVLGDSCVTWRQTNTEDCILTYLPGTHERIIHDRINEQKLFNTWSDAEWRKGWVPDPHATCPAIVDEFFKCFLADDESQTFVKAWLRDAVFDRAEPILILCGKPGAGKNIFVQSIAGNLIGMHNYRSASRGFNKSAFHNGVSKCRLFFLDEMTLNSDARETLKSYHNGLAAIERKGKDVGDPERLHASFVLANNLPSKIYLDYTDRKFYVPILSEVSLMQSMGRDRVAELVDAMTGDIKMQRQLASYLFHNFKPQQARLFPKNKFFRKLCLNSYSPEFRSFIHACFEMETFNNKTLARARRRSMDSFELRDWVDNYEAQFGEPLADLTINGDSTWVAVSKVYVPKDLTHVNGSAKSPIMMDAMTTPEDLKLEFPAEESKSECLA